MNSYLINTTVMPIELKHTQNDRLLGQKELLLYILSNLNYNLLPSVIYSH